MYFRSHYSLSCNRIYYIITHYHATESIILSHRIILELVSCNHLIRLVGYESLSSSNTVQPKADARLLFYMRPCTSNSIILRWVGLTLVGPSHELMAQRIKTFLPCTTSTPTSSLLFSSLITLHIENRLPSVCLSSKVHLNWYKCKRHSRCGWHWHVLFFL